MTNELKKVYGIDIKEIIANLITDYPGHSAHWLSRVAGCSESHARRILNDFVVSGIATVKDRGQGCYHDYRWSCVLSSPERAYGYRDRYASQIGDFIEPNWKVIFPK